MLKVSLVFFGYVRIGVIVEYGFYIYIEVVDYNLILMAFTSV